jgi:outer membrane biosynthesis protein TonB
MSTELTTIQSQKEYAEILSASNLLPRAYQKQPANVFTAMAMGEALGLKPIEAINSINVIQGKPALSAELMGAMVRRAGHKLRITCTKNPPTATATLIRRDDPDAPFTVTWDEKAATRAGLWMSSPSWQKYPDQMMRARAITEVCRMGAADALSGFVYTAEELGGEPQDVFSPSPIVQPVQAAPETETVEVIEVVENPEPKPEPEPEMKPKRKPGRPRKTPKPEEPPAQDTETAPSGDETPLMVDTVTGEVIAPETGKQPPEQGSPEDTDYHLALVREYQDILGIAEERMQASAVWAMQGDAPAGEWTTWPARTLEAIWRNLRKEAVNRGLIKEGE